MNQRSKEIICQVEEQKSAKLNRSTIEYIWLQLKDIMRKGKQYYSKLRKLLKVNVRNETKDKTITLPKDIKELNLQVGEHVVVRSSEEIQRTLDIDGKLQGCAFTKEMWPYCGKEMVVFKRVDSFLNETNNKIQKISNTVLLENAFCSGKRSFGEVCNRSCFLFWKEAWLKRIQQNVK